MQTIRFVRQKLTWKFLSADGAWVLCFDQARVFVSTWQAADFCYKHDIHQAEIVMRMGPPEYDVVIDLL
jgi:hypothetical protein